VGLKAMAGDSELNEILNKIENGIATNHVVFVGWIEKRF